jgi:HEXXH motif-containing protein
MKMEFSFPPDGARARLIDLRMRGMLADSLDYITGQIEDQLSFDRDSLVRLAADLRSGQKYPPSTFALYTELVLSLSREDFPAAESLLEELSREIPVDEGARILALDSPRLSSQAGRLVRLMDSDPNAGFPIIPPRPEVASLFDFRLRRSLDLIERAIPELAAEIESLISQIILVVGDAKGGYVFDGGSCYMMWGGLFLNAESHANEVALVEVLAHESAHMLLFGYCRDEALVNNSDSDLYPSPLRVDPRPMDGIYHATFVSVRMHWAMAKMIESGLLNPAECEIARANMQADKMNFEAGYAVVHHHGDLTATGQAVMQAAREYMDTQL